MNREVHVRICGAGGCDSLRLPDLYVRSGRLHLVLADHDLTLGAGEVAEFDTRLPHWFGSTGRDSVEILSLLGHQGQRMHVRQASVTE